MIMMIRMMTMGWLIMMTIIIIMIMMHSNGTCKVETVADKGAPAKEVGQAKPPSCVIIILKSHLVV